MTDSTFNSALDALVQGEQPVTPDDLTRFAVNLYREEHHMIMPPALKQRIALDLSLYGAPQRSPAPTSPHAARAGENERAFARRRLPVAFTVVMAIALALTGVLQWGTRPNDSDDRFGLLSPAVPTAEATPAASLEEAECQDGQVFEPDYEVRADAPINLRPGPGVQSGDAIAAMPGGSPLMFLCKSTLSTDPEIDDLYEDQVWMKMRTESGEEGWVREVDVEPRVWGTPVPPPTIAETTEIEPISASTSVPSDDDVQVDPTPSSTMPPEIEPIDVNPTPAR